MHVYNKNLPLVGRVRDHDNIEEKHVLDIVSSFCMKSDSGFYVDTFHTTRLGMEDGTLLYVWRLRNFQAGSVKTASFWISKKKHFKIRKIRYIE